jgi:hypothetical protein
VGADAPLFSNEACAAIAHASGGIPRSINILCDTALVYGFASGAERINTQIVELVIEDKKEFGVFNRATSLSSKSASGK